MALVTKVSTNPGGGGGYLRPFSVLVLDTSNITRMPGTHFLDSPKQLLALRTI